MKKLLFALALIAFPLLAGEDLVKNVKHVNDKVYIDHIPQISQKRNFCAPAATSMVLRYYDEKIPQAKLARLFDTSQKRGTASNLLVAAFQSGAIEGFSIRCLYAMSQAEFNALFDEYGSMVSKSKMRKIVKMGNRAFEAADPDVAVPLFAKMRKNLRDLMLKAVKEHIDRGIPLLWSVEMNFDPEDRTPGAHMRLIIGYAVDKKGGIDRVIYRDPWGKASHKKSMTLDNAVAMTYEILVISPTGQAPRK